MHISKDALMSLSQEQSVYILQVTNKFFLVVYDGITQLLLPVDGLLQILRDHDLPSFRPSSRNLVKFLLSYLHFVLQTLKPEPSKHSGK